MTEPGHNNPPPYDTTVYEDLEKRIEEFNAAAAEYLDLGELQDSGQAERLNDFLAGARKLEKDVDDSRKSAKGPWDEKAREVQTAYQKLQRRIEAIKDKPKGMLAAWMRKERERAEKAKAEELERVRKERQRIADMAAQAQARNDVSGQADAEAELERVQKAEAKLEKTKATARVGSASGGTKAQGLRTIKKGRIIQLTRVMMHYKDHPDLKALLERLVNADIRSRDVDHTQIPGIEIYEEETV